MNRERALQVVLTLVGLVFLVGVYPLMMFLWPSGWRWQPHQPEYEQMVLGVYATLGVACCATECNSWTVEPTSTRLNIASDKSPISKRRPSCWDLKSSRLPQLSYHRVSGE